MDLIARIGSICRFAAFGHVLALNPIMVGATLSIFTILFPQLFNSIARLDDFILMANYQHRSISHQINQLESHSDCDVLSVSARSTSFFSFFFFHTIRSYYYTTPTLCTIQPLDLMFDLSGVQRIRIIGCSHSFVQLGRTWERRTRC